MEDKWEKLREIVREETRLVVREEIAALSKKPKIDLIGGKWIGITEEQLEGWRAAYGAVDLDAELKKAAAWCLSNPTLAPQKNKGRFLNTWLTRCQDRASLKAIPTLRAVEPPKLKLCSYCEKVGLGNMDGI